MSLFDQPSSAPKESPRPKLPAGTPTDFEVGFLFNFATSRSSNFDLEAVLIYNRGNITEYKRISLNSQIALGFLQGLDESFYNEFMEFSDNKILKWMTATGNQFVQNTTTGSWRHSSGRELKNLRKHYRNLLQKLWPRLTAWPKLFILKTGRFNNYSPETIRISSAVPEIRLSAELKKDTIVLKLNLFLDGQLSKLVLYRNLLLEKHGVLYLPPDTEALQLFELFAPGDLSFPLSMKMEVVKKYILPWLAKYPVDISDKLDITLSTSTMQTRVALSELNESSLMIRGEFIYEATVVEHGAEENLVIEEETKDIKRKVDKIRIVHRDKEGEKRLHEYLRTLHSTFSNQRNNSYYHLPFDEVMRKGWFIDMMRKVQEQGYPIHGLSSLQKFRYTTHIPKFSVAVTSNGESFDLNIHVHWGDQEVPLKEIRMAIMNWQDTIMLSDGTLGHIPEEWVKQYSLLLRTGKEQNGVLKVSKMHFALLEDLLENMDAGSRSEMEDRKRKLLGYDSIEKAPLSKAIKASLRPYQMSGFHFMQALDELGWGGCLADDMGLGKTLQTISFLQFVKEKYPGSTQLVICPTSLIFNWEGELQKFAPTLKFRRHYGTQRELKDEHIEDVDVVLTSYGTVRNDIEELSGVLWQYIILDESQFIKNPDARTTRAIQQLRSVNRIILSGTPVQNNTFDLFSQFNFLNPGQLGSREFFNREFAVPIDKLGSKEKAQYLRKLIHPFTLRRTKEQVATDLPDKTITVLWCTMEASQRKLYNEYRDGYRSKLLKKIDEEGISKSGLEVLEGLLRLRQICDHPVLVNDNDELRDSSVKINELIREVTENAGHHKLLIFSQFTQMLHLIRDEFEKAGIEHCYLDGSTSLNKRQEEVDKFQNHESIKAFLISLKAGGVGLNLTKADYVYIVDPWWNPAAEAQAIDRAHRIGQQNKVFAYKMICKDSVEERILQLQERKKNLADDLIQEDSNFVKTLSRDDVEFLFG
ncbi:DEAD/DEAH box helicase [Chryseolinea sp. T2]|uniref:DEAD/DEAH box helicase n=1 Tax=Chryseolinea sp. T2 TaxID=3129255 RepID=UPI0030773327